MCLLLGIKEGEVRGLFCNNFRLTCRLQLEILLVDGLNFGFDSTNCYKFIAKLLIKLDDVLHQERAYTKIFLTNQHKNSLEGEFNGINIYKFV